MTFHNKIPWLGDSAVFIRNSLGVLPVDVRVTVQTVTVQGLNNNVSENTAVGLFGFEKTLASKQMLPRCRWLFSRYAGCLILFLGDHHQGHDFSHMDGLRSSRPQGLRPRKG